MLQNFAYTIKARLGGTFDESDAIQDVQEGIARAYDRLWDELQELVLRGGPEEFKATFAIVVEEATELEEDE